ncbi:hypothetical protein LCM23_12990 [Cytobacillus kochii]|uniref:hypothetical protein n=1 Tax=Cytobacillus kochii TaxID=859143 RepID=UPI001CD57DF8|nr:hypothetical protein [Cytobacillus kochii]MCA1027010.1 hypothetical protein [Cytobacillus kochii]
MDGKDYKVKWYARGMDFNYSGTRKVWAYGTEDAKERVITRVSKEMCLSKSLINIESIEQ